MSSGFKRGNAQVHANLTPMIDVTFLLIVFFVLVSQIVDLDSVDMELPHPEHPVTVLPGEDARAVINVVPGLGGAALGYRVGTFEFAATDVGRTELAGHLATLYRLNPALNINLRADRRTEYQYVAPVMRAVTNAAGLADVGIPSVRVNLVVVREE